MPDVTLEQVLRLDFDEMTEELELPVVLLSVAFLLVIWNRRCSNSRIRTYDIRAEMESKVSLLRETRFKHHVDFLNLFCGWISIV